MKRSLKPERVVPGDTIGFMSTSSAMAAQLPERVERARLFIQRLGFKVKIAKNSLLASGYTAGTGQQRASDFHSLLRDKNVKAIVSFIGGNHSIHMLPYIDYSLVESNPKVLLGYSDTTVLQLALYARTGLVTFSGPAVLTQFAEYPRPFDYTIEYLLRAISSKQPIGAIDSSKLWTEELLDWFSKESSSRARKLQKNNGHWWLRKGTAQGKLIGGCISSIMHLRGTPYWPDFRKKLFFWEIPEGSDLSQGEDISYIDTYLEGLKLCGVFDQISGMIVGRPYGYSEHGRSELLRVLKRVLRGSSFPVLMDVDFGHTDPVATIPIGVKAELNCSQNSFHIIERATKN